MEQFDRHSSLFRRTLHYVGLTFSRCDNLGLSLSRFSAEWSLVTTLPVWGVGHHDPMRFIDFLKRHRYLLVHRDIYGRMNLRPAPRLLSYMRNVRNAASDE